VMAFERRPKLLGVGEIRRIAREFDVVPSKRLGQNFVHDSNTIRKIAMLAGVGNGDHVLEVGPGFGSLTLGLLATGASVSAVELDSRVASGLRHVMAKYAAGSAVSIHVADARTFTELTEGPTSLVANLPYNLSVPILLKLLSRFSSINSVLVMVQREVGERIISLPGSKVFGSPSVKAQWFGNWKLVCAVPRTVFWPVPNVDSVLIQMRASTPPGNEKLRKLVFELVDNAFANRRKMVRTALAEYIGSARVRDVILAAGLSPEARAEQWGLGEFVALAKSVMVTR